MFDADVLIIGAGVAGLKAGSDLHRAGLRVIVLEARDRIGGRTYSVREGERVTDLGASWIHGVNNNPLAEATASFGMQTTEFTVGSFQPGGRPIIYFDPEGKALSLKATEDFITDIHLFDAELKIIISNIIAGSSYADAVAKTFSRFDWSAQRKERVREFMQHRTEEQYGAHITELDAHGLDDDQVDGDEVVFAAGFDQLSKHLALHLTTLLKHKVSKVSWHEGKVTVFVGSKKFVAPRVVVTVPVGILKSADFVIEPPLPQTHLKALNGLEMNAFEKIFLHFDEKFWPDDIYAFRQQGAAGVWWHSFYDLTAIHGVPTLLTFAAGPAARALLNFNVQEVQASIMQQLHRLFGDRALEPVNISVTNWQGDPYSLGSYAFMKVGSKTSDHEVLATPVANTLFFAGEATWEEDPATVTAAFMSGARVADLVLAAG